MRIVVTGGTGFIGTPLLAALQAAGHDVVALTRTPARMTGPQAAAGVRYAPWDASPDGAWVQQIDGADAVINLAGEPIAEGRWDAAKKARIRSSRLVATDALAAAIGQARHRPAVLISGSAIGYYGARGPERVTETAPPGTDFLAGVCRDWEDAAQRAAQYGTRVVLLRSGIVLGPGGGALAKMLPAFRLGLGGPLAGGRQGFSWIHLDDEIGLILWALQQPGLQGPLNLTAPRPVSQKEFARTLGEVLHRPAVVPTPAIALRTMFGEMAETLVSGAFVYPQQALDLRYPFRFPELKGALQDVLNR